MNLQSTVFYRQAFGGFIDSAVWLLAKRKEGKMSEQFRHDASAVGPQADPDVAALIKQIQQQLVFLEKKIDTLINQSQERPFKEKHFPKPFSKPFRPFGRRPFGHSHRRGKGEQGHSLREGDFNQGRPFARPGNSLLRAGEKRQGDENQGFGQKKKTFFHRRKNRR